MVAVHSIEPHAEGIRQGRGELNIPPERTDTEAVGKGDETAVPVVYVHVPRIDGILREEGGALLRALLDAGETRRIDDAHTLEPAAQEKYLVDLVMTEPEPLQRETVRACLVDDGAGRVEVLHVDAEVDHRFDGLEVLRERGHVRRQFVTVDVGNADPSDPAAHHSVVFEHNHAVLGDPRIGLDTVGTQFDRQLKRMNGVLGCVSPGPSVGERNRVFALSGESLLHARRIEAPSYAGRVFNLTGSEIIFVLLAGLVVLGPERLPGVIRTVGRIYGQVRGMAQGLEREIKDTFAEPVSDLKNTARQIRNGFGEVDTEPSPPMRPELARNPDADETPPDTPDETTP